MFLFPLCDVCFFVLTALFIRDVLFFYNDPRVLLLSLLPAGRRLIACRARLHTPQNILGGGFFLPGLLFFCGAGLTRNPPGFFGPDLRIFVPSPFLLFTRVSLTPFFCESLACAVFFTPVFTASSTMLSC